MKTGVFKKEYYYKFKDGRAFYVQDICTCEQCEKRGLYEPIVVWLDDCNNGWNTDYITPNFYEKIVGDIKIESATREARVDEYINNTVAKRINDLETDLQVYIGSWKFVSVK